MTDAEQAQQELDRRSAIAELNRRGGSSSPLLPSPPSSFQPSAPMTAPLPAVAPPIGDTLTARPPLGPVAQGLNYLSPRLGSQVQDAMESYALPTVMTALAPELRIGRGLGVIGKSLMEGAGNAVGTQINQATGLQPPDPTAVAIAAGVPMFGRGVAQGIGAGSQGLVRSLPGTASVQNRMAATEAAGIAPALQPQVSARTLFSQVQHAGVPLTETTAVTTNLLATPRAISPEVQTYLKDLQKEVTSSGSLTPLALHDELMTLGRKIAASDRGTGYDSGPYKAVFAALQKDLDARIATRGPGAADAQQLKTARSTSRRELALQDLEEWIDVGGATKINRGQGKDIQFNANYVLKKMDTDRLFAGSFTPDEVAKMKTTFQRLNNVPVLDTPANVNAGSMRVMRNIAGVGSAGYMAGGTGMAAAGGAIAALGPPVVRWLVSTKAGQSLVESALKSNKGIFDQRVAAILSAGAYSALQGSNAPRQDTESAPAQAAPQGLPSPAAVITPSESIDTSIAKSAKEHDVDPHLVRAMIKAESAFNPKAVSPVGAMGLMQLMPKTATSLGVTDAYDPGQNIAGGVKHLRHLLDQFDGDVPMAVAAYNAGETRVRQADGIPHIPETQEYVRRVLQHYKEYGATAPAEPKKKGKKVTRRVLRDPLTKLITGIESTEE